MEKRTFRRECVFCIGLVIIFTHYCTSENPAYTPPELSATDGAATIQHQDMGPSGEIGFVDAIWGVKDSAMDVSPNLDGISDEWMLPDASLPPDVAPKGCTTHSQCDDLLWCTKDLCNASGVCENTLMMNMCLINGACVMAGKTASDNSCAVCQPSNSTWKWTYKPDTSVCTDDNLGCTSDYCKKGKCIHEVKSGCVIDGKCYADNEYIKDYAYFCFECQSKKSKTNWTFIEGKHCYTGPGSGICINGACRGWSESEFEPPGSANAQSTSLKAVDYFPDVKEVWAAGTFVDGSSVPRGVLTPLTPSAATTKVVPTPLAGLHYGLAIGEEGTSWRLKGKRWDSEDAITQSLGNGTARGVWGATIKGVRTYFVSGLVDQNINQPGMVRCAAVGLGYSCVPQLGFDTGSLVGAVWGTVTPSGTLGPLWAPVFTGGTVYSEHIYANPGSGAVWSKSPPLGCTDSFLSPSACSKAIGSFRDIHGSGADNVWIVGDHGTMVYFDGKMWNPGPQIDTFLKYYTLNAVFVSSNPPVVITVGYRGHGVGRLFSTFTYNTELKRGFGPINILLSTNTTDEIFDIGGDGFGNLYMVGQKTVNNKVKGWILKLQ